MNKINISTIGLFHTPKTQDELFDWIERLPTSERVAATTAYGMTWNYLATQINEAQEDDDQN